MKITIKDIPTHLLKQQLDMIKIILADYKDAKKDATKAAVAALHIITELNNRGCNLKADSMLYCVTYWQGENIANEPNNRNPITGFDEYYNILRKNPNQSIDKRRWEMIKKIDEEIKLRNSYAKEPEVKENAKYQLKVAWTGEFKYEDQIKEFFEELELGTPEIETYNTGQGEEHLLLYIFQGSPDSFKILKRSVSAMLNIFCNENFEIGISGKKI